MRTFYLTFFTLFSLTIFTNSCRSDKETENNQYNFTIVRDSDFQRKIGGETTNIVFNINASYNFNTVPMYIKYSSNFDSELKLDNIILEKNKEYQLKNQNNFLEYVGKEAGIHNVSISVKNEKGQSLTETFILDYIPSGFTFLPDATGNSNKQYKGQDYTYTEKIIPERSSDTKGYTIKFKPYSGIIKFNNIKVEFDKEYPISDISNFSITTNSNISGKQILKYTVKNFSISEEIEVHQQISES
ncbi:hypothetical protein M2T82_01015 [Elizabethkingia ursingii]|uniref:hypothetical protein n=1 Tax=Elizabethkingia TaxID=308865 RepID=UPI000D3278A6|nr:MULTISPECIES: hypothetical protein [Elizabethkingia]MCL1666633.1 hypothetical protein [Elizabethkingia ursingii]PUB33713.1 hypothetical protein C8J95_103313 [Elizabethkingia sp. YR214]